jgi:hypothetical protein
MILRKDTTYRMNYLRVTPQIGGNALQPGVVDSGHVTIVSRSVAALDQLQLNAA